MSLVRSGDHSSTSYGNHKLYSLEESSNSSGLSTPVFNSDKHRTMYATGSYSGESYDLKYFLDSPAEELIHPPRSNEPGNQFHHQVASCYQLMPAQNSFNSPFATKRHHNPCQTNFDLEYLESPSPDTLDYDEDKMRLKLQELESALLSNNDGDDDIFSPNESMDMDGEWTEPIHHVMLHDSPKESSSSVSNGSSISSNKEISLTTARTPKQMLFDCAAGISDGHIEEASTMINELRQRVSIQGDPPQRIAAYMVEALAARMATSGKGLYKALKCKEPPSNDRLSAMQVLFEVCPCFRFGFMAANGAIMEVFKDEKIVHIIDFDISQGSQYITLIQTLGTRPGKLPHLRLTGVDDPESVQRPIGGLKMIGQRLEKLAEQYEISFEFRAVASKTSIVTPAILNCQPGEALVVNFAFQLHHMPDESVSTVNQRDQLLRMVKSLNPKLVTIVEQDVNTNTAPFLPRFVEAYNYYSAVFESLDATLPRDSQERLNVERQCLARDIVNIVACEGEERIERYEVAGKWRARMMMAGFTSCPISPNVNDAIKKLIKQYCDRYKVNEEMGALHFGWEDKVLIVASAWR
ncbi:scarecrow-like protein 1 [Cornus florida]|uniref:scarecrow-like protein 1 n=1 Tax=Cornus florida TaxID=4283 RepID=UPI002899CA95|nr:scarecrow-like protein 1 [Cornus florida]XP_059630572.1 scarecrow-like protein 1 [Cornus florida]XP_059630573.1 scarecrow-like protein 1 [Cornus florida]